MEKPEPPLRELSAFIGATRSARSRKERIDMTPADPIPPPVTPPLRWQIIDRAHPHFPEHGSPTGNVISLFGEEMAEMKLDNCQHGTEACFVGRGQVSKELSR